jgi:LuxR family maltose regulon positive regulatory protein
MTVPVLATKLYIPPLRPGTVPRPSMVGRLKESLAVGCKLTLISAPAGFGKTTLVSEWIAGCGRPVAWLSLDSGDSDPTRFLTYLVTALQTIAPKIGAGLLAALQSPQPPATESILTALLNDISSIPDDFVLVLDDYHAIDSRPVDEALTFLLDHLPPPMHLVIATREDPHVPLARLRARGQLTELRAADLRFTPAEAAEFLNQMMGLNLSDDDVAALERRTEGWIAGLQLAALSMQGHQDIASFIKSFTGSHHFVLDYLVEEVLQHQPESVQTFLLRTSILDRMCGPLCDVVLGSPSTSGQETLEYLEHANLFIVPLDSERHWYRYHHLFAELLRQRLYHSASSGNEAEYHIRASVWYEENGQDLEAFQHAAAANDIERAARLMEGKGMPLHFRFAVMTILGWLESLPKTVLDGRPLLWVRYASMALIAGQTAGVAERLEAAEAALAAALQGREPGDEHRDLIGQIAAARATLALLSQYRIEEIIAQSQRALEYLSPDNLTFRFTAIWALGAAYQIQGDRAAAERVLTEAFSISQRSGKKFHLTLASNGLGLVQELENQLYKAAATYQRGLQLAGDYPHPTSTSQTYLGLARIYYEWNDLDTAERYGQQSLLLRQQFDQVNLFIISEVFLTRLKLARGDVAGAAAMLAKIEQSVHQQNFVHRIPEVAAARVLILLRQGSLETAAHLAQMHGLPFSQARVYLAQGDPSAALAVLEPLRRQMEAKGWADELLKVMVLQTVALHANGEKDKAAQLLGEALALAEPGGFVRIFVDEGEAMRLVIEKQSRNRDHPLSGYTDKLLAAFTQPPAAPKSAITHQETAVSEAAPLYEALSERELEVLRLLRSELSGPEIAQQLVVSLNTLRSHTKNIFNKLGVNNRRAAIRRAKELDLF